MLITAFYLFWPDSHGKPLEWKIFVDAPLGRWLATPVILTPESATEHLRTDASEIIGEIGHECFLFYRLIIQSFFQK